MKRTNAPRPLLLPFSFSGRRGNSLDEKRVGRKGERPRGCVCAPGKQGKRKERSQADEQAREVDLTHLLGTTAHVFVHCVPEGDTPTTAVTHPLQAAQSALLGKVGRRPTPEQSTHIEAPLVPYSPVTTAYFHSSCTNRSLTTLPNTY